MHDNRSVIAKQADNACPALPCPALSWPGLASLPDHFNLRATSEEQSQRSRQGASLKQGTIWLLLLWQPQPLPLPVAGCRLPVAVCCGSDIAAFAR
ncbi:GL23595 [Drosophila persimilis]|uniref:GL23595 n=1 Tax=Drosophila persimilis TaxID=7234 RepID=B4G2I9_DROPE|nr:GL23595 [Drosophila persimilis]